MQFSAHKSVKHYLLTGFSFAVIILLIVGFVGSFGIRKVYQSLEKLSVSYYPTSAKILELRWKQSLAKG